jgi:hypothetical protein
MRILNKIVVFVIGILVVSGLVTTHANAQADSTGAAQGLQISPALVELNAAQGKTYTVTLHVTNVTASDLSYSTSTDDFNAADETGTPHILLDSTLPATVSMRSWIATVPPFTLQARKSQVIAAQITIPTDAEPGGHYGVLRFSGSAPELKDTGVGLSASAGVLMLIRVDGAITEKASLASFTSESNGKQSSFFENGPLTFVTRIQNEGNVHVKPVGSIELRDMFGGLVTTMPVNADKSNVLPSSIRRFEATYANKWLFGRYTANLTLGYGTTGQAITNTISFWVIPYKLILVGLIILATVIFILSRMVKVYNRRIIAKSKNENTTKNKKPANKKD